MIISFSVPPPPAFHEFHIFGGVAIFLFLAGQVGLLSRNCIECLILRYVTAEHARDISPPTHRQNRIHVNKIRAAWETVFANNENI